MVHYKEGLVALSQHHFSARAVADGVKVPVVFIRNLGGMAPLALFGMCVALSTLHSLLSCV